MRKRWKLLLSLALTGAILAALYSLVDPAVLGRVLTESDPLWLGAYFALFAPQLALAALRWQSLVRHFGDTRLGFGRAFSQCVGAYAANLLIPSKMGEFVKGVWLKTGDRAFLPFFLVALEKVLDVLSTLGILTLALVVVLPEPQYQPRGVLAPILAALLVSWAAGLLLLRGPWPVRLANRFILKGDEAELRDKWRSVVGKRGPLASVMSQSVLLWIVQLLQFWCMFMVFGVSVDLRELFVGAPIGLLAGAMPLTTGGIGLRDAALLWYFGSGLTYEVVLSVGILSFLRILVAGVVGVPFFFMQMREGRHGS